MSDDPGFLFVLWMAVGLTAWLFALLYLIDRLFT